MLQVNVPSISNAFLNFNIKNSKNGITLKLVSDHRLLYRSVGFDTTISVEPNRIVKYKVYGNRYTVYTYDKTNKDGSHVVYKDSIFCPEFTEKNLTIEY